MRDCPRRRRTASQGARTRPRRRARSAVDARPRARRCGRDRAAPIPSSSIHAPRPEAPDAPERSWLGHAGGIGRSLQGGAVGGHLHAAAAGRAAGGVSACRPRAALVGPRQDEGAWLETATRPSSSRAVGRRSAIETLDVIQAGLYLALQRRAAPPARAGDGRLFAAPRRAQALPQAAAGRTVSRRMRSASFVPSSGRSRSYASSTSRASRRCCVTAPACHATSARSRSSVGLPAGRHRADRAEHAESLSGMPPRKISRSRGGVAGRWPRKRLLADNDGGVGRRAAPVSRSPRRTLSMSVGASAVESLRARPVVAASRFTSLAVQPGGRPRAPGPGPAPGRS